MILVFDTETTGKTDFRSSFTASHQPHLVQLGAQLLDDKFVVRAELNLIIRPRGFQIPATAAAVHGITQDIAETFGVELDRALGLFTEMRLKARAFVAHNFQFDELVISTAYHRAGEIGNQWLDGDQDKVCTMRAMTPICQLPNLNGYSDFKWPTLQEAHKRAFGEPFEGAHDAMADVRACARIYKWITERPKPRETNLDEVLP